MATMASVQMLSLWLRYLITLWITLLLPSSVLPETIYRVDPLALLSATLRTYQRAGCETETISLSCPRGTSISIELAQYGRAGDITDNSLCPVVSEDQTTAMLDEVQSGTEIEVKPPESCAWPNALQYALLQTVVEACQKKRHCKFTAPSKSVTGDPCPGVRKFVEIAYKCRPYEFRSKVACENDMIQLVCNPYSRIAIYGASFGRSEYDSVQCAQPHGIKEETCLASYATETVMQICHGRRRCSLTADSGTFGKPCRQDSRMYLKVVYTCIPRKVLKDRYDTSPEPDEPQQSEFDIDQDELYDEDQFYKESEAIPPAPKLQGGLSNPGHPFDFLPDESSSSVIPPLLSRNDNSLEEEETLNGKELGPDSSSVITEAVSETVGYNGGAVVVSVTAPSTHATTESFLIPKLENGDIFGRSHNTNEEIEEFISSSSPILPKYFIRRRHHRRRPSGGSDTGTKPTKKLFGQSFTNDKDLLNSTEIDVREMPGIGFECSPESLENGERVEVIGFLVEWIQAYIFVAQNQERFYLYLIVSVAAGVVLCLILVVGRLVIHKRRRAKPESKFQQSSSAETQLPNGFSDDISEIDADIDLTTPLPVPSVTRNENYMTYTPSPSPYGGSLAPSNVSHTSTTMLVPTSSLMVSGGSRQPTPPPNLIPGSGPLSAYMGPPPPVSGPMGSLMPISSVSHHTTAPPYLPGAMMVSHHGTLRRTMVPAGGGMMTSASPTPPPAQLGIVAPNVCYEGTLPRSLSRGMPDNSQYYYG